LVYLSYSTGKLNIKREGYYVYAVFDEIAGLDTKAPVMLNGREVGKVEDIDIEYKGDSTRIVLKIWLSEEAKIRDDASVSIKTLGLMGEKYIQISSSEGKNFIRPEAVLIGKPYMDLDVLMEEAKGIADEIKNLAGSLNSTLEGNQDNVSQIIENLESASANMEEFTEDIKNNPWKLLFRAKEKRTE
jgi:phospholipid/cholesterol/gamma-HCH transport system substrate-binding protein